MKFYFFLYKNKPKYNCVLRYEEKIPNPVDASLMLYRGGTPFYLIPFKHDLNSTTKHFLSFSHINFKDVHFKKLLGSYYKKNCDCSKSS